MAAAPLRARADSAEDTAVARDLFREGAALAQQGNWEQALDRYARSLRLKRGSLTLYSLGVAQKQLGQLVEARESFRAFLAEPSSTATQPFEQPARTAIEEIDARVGRVTIQVTPPNVPGLVVKIDGVRVSPGEIGAARAVNPGGHELTATATGYAAAKTSVLVRDGEALTASLALVPGDSSSSSSGPQLTVVNAPSQPDRTFPMVLMGTGVSIFTTGLAVGLLGVIDANEAPTSDGTMADKASSKALVGDIIGGTGIAMFGVGLVVYLVNGPKKPDAAKPDAAATVVRPWARGDVGGVEVRF